MWRQPPPAVGPSEARLKFRRKLQSSCGDSRPRLKFRRKPHKSSCGDSRPRLSGRAKLGSGSARSYRAHVATAAPGCRAERSSAQVPPEATQRPISPTENLSIITPWDCTADEGRGMLLV